MVLEASVAENGLEWKLERVSVWTRRWRLRHPPLEPHQPNSFLARLSRLFLRILEDHRL
jgi:hypothetical protein